MEIDEQTTDNRGLPQALSNYSWESALQELKRLNPQEKKESINKVVTIKRCLHRNEHVNSIPLTSISQIKRD